MGTIWVRELIGGLDTRKMAETTPGGVLLVGRDGHITRGGEFEKRAAFVSAYALPIGTVSLAYTPASLVAFGSGEAPAMPVGVAYQRLQHPDLATALVRVASFDLYAGKIYAAGVFADGTIHHFYDGTRITNWYDGRARATFTITAGAGAVAATGSLTVISGVAGSIDDVTVGGVSIIDNPVPAGADEAATATALAVEINSASAGFSAAAVSALVTITAPVPGVAYNGQIVTAAESGGMDVGTFVNMAGGAAAGALTAVTVAGVNALGAPVAWQGTASATAAAITNQINAATTSPEYVAVQNGAAFAVISSLGGAAANGRAVTFTTSGTLTLAPTSGALAGGADPQAQTDAVAATSVFTVTASAPGTEAVGTFEVNSTVADETVTALTVSGTSLIPGTQNYAGAMSSADIATALAATIAAYSGTSGFTAAPSGTQVNVTTIGRGASVNGASFASSTTGGLTLTTTAVFAGGSDAGRLLGMTIDAVSVCGFVEGNTDTSAMAAAIASAITSFTSSPEYTAAAVGGVVTISAAVAGAAANGRAVIVSKGAGLTLSPAAPPAMNNGKDAAAGTFQPGDFVRTIGSKEYSLSGPNMHFSGIKAPTQWTTDTTGAGFIDMSSEASGAEQLVALAKYLDRVAVFAERSIQVWYVDPDPTLNKQSQVLNNTGTRCPRSVTQFGDTDIFYTDTRGIRSLRARATTNSASTSDVGVAVDTLVGPALAALTTDELRNVIGVIEPRDGRFWLSLKDDIYVFSFFGDGKISAWTTYRPGFAVQDMVPFQGRVYLRSGDTIHVYGGLGTEPVYDDTGAEAWLPYLDGGKPAQKKNWQGIDAALRGEWEVRIGMDPVNQDASDKIGIIFRTSYNESRIPLIGESSHISVRLTSKGSGQAQIGSLVIHYEGDLED